MSARVQDSDLRIPLEPLISSMTLEQKRELLAWLASDAEVVKSVTDFICGEDEYGWCCGDANLRGEMLARVEDSQLRHGLQFSWRPWQEAAQKIRDIRAEEHLYWVLYHKLDPDLSGRVMEELRRLGVKSNYTTDVVDAEISRIRAVFDEALRSMVRQEQEGGAA